MTKCAAARMSVCLGIVLLAVMLVLAAAHPAGVQGEPSGMDIRQYIVGGSGYELLSSTVVVVSHMDDHVTLRGPITIRVTSVAADPDSMLPISDETITLGAGETRTFKCASPTGGWNVGLVSSDDTSSTQSTTTT